MSEKKEKMVMGRFYKLTPKAKKLFPIAQKFLKDLDEAQKELENGMVVVDEKCLLSGTKLILV